MPSHHVQPPFTHHVGTEWMSDQPFIPKVHIKRTMDMPEQYYFHKTNYNPYVHSNNQKSRKSSNRHENEAHPRTFEPDDLDQRIRNIRNNDDIFR